MMSMAVPGVIGAMIVTSRFGYCSCARASPPRQAASTAPVIARRFETVIAYPPRAAVTAFVVFVQ